MNSSKCKIKQCAFDCFPLSSGQDILSQCVCVVCEERGRCVCKTFLERAIWNSNFFSFNIEVIDCIWTGRMWEHTHTHSHTLNRFMNTCVWKCEEKESQSNVENRYNLIEIERIAIDVWVELRKWYCEYFICVSIEKLTQKGLETFRNPNHPLQYMVRNKNPIYSIVIYNYWLFWEIPSNTNILEILTSASQMCNVYDEFFAFSITNSWEGCGVFGSSVKRYRDCLWMQKRLSTYSKDNTTSFE
jgi:hypothetical protein